MAAILIVEDELQIADAVSAHLQSEGHDCVVANEGWSGLDLAFRKTFSVAILDWKLPDMDGLSLCARIAEYRRSRVLMLSARSNESDRLRAFESGADDYVTKPFSLRELAARVRRLAASPLPGGSSVPADAEAVSIWRRPLRQGELVVNTATYTAAFEGRELPLTPVELRLLAVLMEQPRRPKNCAQIAASLADGLDLCKADHTLASATVQAHLHHLRQKLKRYTGQDPLKNDRGLGYYLE